VDPSASGDADGTGGSEDPSSDGSASGASGGGEDGSGSGGDESTGGDSIEGVCGDGWLDTDEFCDDGNTRSGDGCESDCTSTIGVAAFSVGGEHTCAVSYAGTVRCFGDNTWGQLGLGSTDTIGDDETPLEHDRNVKLPDVGVVAAGLNHTCALTLQHEVYCWGDNRLGQLGLGHTKAWGDELGEVPERVELDGPVSAIAAGESHTCALLYGGEVRCWGSNAVGQLGHGDGFVGTVGAGDLPYPNVLDAPRVPLGENPTVRSLSAGRGDHTCAVSGLGEAYCWGEGADGRLGSGDVKSIGLDVEPADAGGVSISEVPRAAFASTRHTCVVTAEYGLQCFGANDDGQLGLGHQDNLGDDEGVGAVSFDLGREAIVSAALTDRSSCALTRHGTVYCWGSGADGRLGYGSTDAIGDDEVPSAVDGYGPVKLLSATTAIGAGSDHVCALTDDARLRCWGLADGGRLGQGIDDIGAFGDEPQEREPPVVRIFR